MTQAPQEESTAVCIDMTYDDVVYVKIDGEYSANDEEKFVRAVTSIFTRWPNLYLALLKDRENKT